MKLLPYILQVFFCEKMQCVGKITADNEDGFSSSLYLKEATKTKARKQSCFDMVPMLLYKSYSVRTEFLLRISSLQGFDRCTLGNCIALDSFKKLK